MRLGAAISGVTTGITGLFCGAMLLIGFGMLPYWESLPPLLYRAWFADNGKYLGQVMVPLAQASVAFSWIQAVLFLRKAGRKRTLSVTVAICTTLILCEYIFIHKDLNAILMGTQPLQETEIASMLADWKFWHWIRLGLGLPAFYWQILLNQKRLKDEKATHRTGKTNNRTDTRNLPGKRPIADGG